MPMADLLPVKGIRARAQRPCYWARGLPGSPYCIALGRDLKPMKGAPKIPQSRDALGAIFVAQGTGFKGFGGFFHDWLWQL